MIIQRPKPEIDKRSKTIRLDFNQRYNPDELREQLYREQEGLCAICNKPLQGSDSIVCTIDHAISVSLYATWDYTVEEACQHANARKNLVATHPTCNRAKSYQDMEDFQEAIKHGDVVLGERPTLTKEQLVELKHRAGAGGRIGGRKNVESGHWARLQQLPQTKAARQRTGYIARLTGLRHKQNGTSIFAMTAEERAAAGSKGGRVASRKNVESGQFFRMKALPQTKEAQRKVGRKAVESGSGIFAMTTAERAAAGSKGGRKVVRSGQFARTRALGLHTRWHANRNIVNPKCALCAL